MSIQDRIIRTRQAIAANDAQIRKAKERLIEIDKYFKITKGL